MPSEDPDILVRRFVDGELGEADLKEALHRIADDPDARSLLRFEVRMTQDLATRPAGTPPRDFADRTMEAVADAESEAPSIAARMRAWWTTATTPVSLTVRPMSAVVAMGVGLALLGVLVLSKGPEDPLSEAPPSQTASTAQSSSRVHQASTASPQGETVWIRFRYTDNTADSVAVAGDFSQWDPIPLSPHSVNGQTVWTGLVPVSRGEHEYQFVINGERWVTDPLAPIQRSDGFGDRNAVLKL